MKIAAHTHTDPLDNFLIVAPTYKILQQSTLPEFFRIMRGYGDYSKSESVFKVHGGGTIYCRTGTDPDSIVGITNIRHVWADEAGLLSTYFWENLQARAAFKSAPITLTTSPYTLNWIYREMIRPKMKDATARPDVELIQAASEENPYMSRHVIETARANMDPRRFNALFGGKWERMSGLVYDCFDEVENTCEPFELPKGTKYVAGVDWGYTHPFVILVRAITPSGQHYQVAEVYEVGLTIDKKIDVAKRLSQVFDIDTFYCDPARPDEIAAFCSARLTAVAANNDIRMGIDRQYELIKSRKFKIFRGTSANTLDEIEGYHYPNPEDRGPDKSDKETLPVDKANHAMDCLRYITMATHRLQDLRKPTIADTKSIEQENDIYRRIEMHKRRPKTSRFENWG